MREITIKIKTDLEFERIQHFLFDIDRLTQEDLYTIPRNEITEISEL